MNRMFVIGFMVSVVFLMGIFIGGCKGGRDAGLVVVLPNDVSLMSRYDGDPSLLSAYVRNDSLILNYEGY
jgi:hypothetical protein